MRAPLRACSPSFTCGAHRGRKLADSAPKIRSLILRSEDAAARLR